MVDSQFQLKTAPPRPSRTAATRPRLEHRWAEYSDYTAIFLTAPQGFGKTTLMAQWRRNWLARGAYVAWASLDGQDERARFVDLLLFALRAATGRESFAKAATQSRLQSNRELDALTALMAEVAVLATPTVVVLDDAHRMPQGTLREFLAYLVNNAPPNLQFLVGSRRPLELQLTDLLASGRLAALDDRDLRMSLDETLAVLRARFGSRIELDDAVRLHELTEGWPLGLQLAASTLERAGDVHEMIGRLSARRGEIKRFFFEFLMSRLSKDEAGFLIRISILDSLTADVCEAVTENASSHKILADLEADLPIVTADEDRAWMRLHTLARDFLLGEFDRLPADERRDCHRRAAKWYEEHGQIQEAARHAFDAGDKVLAVAHMSRCLRDIALAGRLGEARDWIRRLPASAMSRDIRLQLTAAWITALGDGAETVPALIAGITGHPKFDDECRFEAALISAAAAGYRDEPGLIADALRSWDRAPPAASPLHVVALANSQATLALHEGDTERVRRLLAHSISMTTRGPEMRLPLAISDLHVGLSYLLEGNPGKVIAFLQPRLALYENEMGRRSPVAAALAGTVAAALFLRNEPERACATLADRLDVVERGGMPDPIIFAYRTLAQISLRNGDEARAFEVLSALRELGVGRSLPRVVLSSLSEQARLHALRGRTDTTAGLLVRIADMRSVFEQPEYCTFVGLFDRTVALTTAHLHLSQSRFDEAEAALRTAAGSVPPSMHRGVTMLVIQALLAMIAHQRGRPEAADMLAETFSLASLAGIRRVIEEAHPGLAGLLSPKDGIDNSGDHRAVGVTAAAPRSNPAAFGLLTPKEAHVLSLLVTGKANKEIARAMDISETTVKWHLRNVFFKLNAASRKHAVDRARLLGLIDN
jgi:LuxR family transcriptional regulator, maltose regulon positive regulatory protein